jgi:hypothetical protein
MAEPQKTVDVLPPVTGIARKERRDKGVPRKSNVAAMSDQFMALDLETQIVMLEVLQALHRQVVKGRIAPAAIESDLAAWYKAHGPAAEVEDAG